MLWSGLAAHDRGALVGAAALGEKVSVADEAMRVWSGEQVD